MSMTAPLEPPMTSLTTAATSLHRRSGSATASFPALPAARMPSAARRKVAPQSPSPTKRSSSERRASAATRAVQTSDTTVLKTFASASDSTRTDVWASCSGGGTTAATVADCRWPTGSRAAAAGQAGARVGASMRAARRLSRATTVMMTPAISRLVIRVPVNTRVTSIPASDRYLNAALATMCISSTDEPPRLFIIRAALGMQLLSPAFSCSCCTSRIRFTSWAVMSSAVPSGCLERPGSPWMPRPTSHSPAAMRSEQAPPGTVQVESATPMEPTASAAARASVATSERLQPAAAEAPATLWTNSVPVRPRRPVTTLSLSSPALTATSSPTMTISTRRP
mmetsp:Transcript_40562/g.114885  ORF Transcript_40562/g.114885 Transcript_40562/m.114885 type:complete len:339 (-) Transcript_40562:612-1628(-)